MSDITSILSAIEQGDPKAAEALLPCVYHELRRLAAQRLRNEKSGQTLQATALVHEAYVRLVKDQHGHDWNSRGHFFAAAAEAMRRILVEQARRKRSERGGGGFKRVQLLDVDLAESTPDEQVLQLNEALGRLEALRPQAAQIVKLRFFSGLTIEESAALMEISPRTAGRLWVFARAWLRREMRPSEEPSASYSEES